MKVTTLNKIKKGDLFYTLKEFEKYGDNEKYLRIKDEYNASIKKWHCPRFTFDPVGNGKLFKSNIEIVII